MSLRGFPNDLTIVVSRAFNASAELVFDVLTKPEHVRKTVGPFGDRVGRDHMTKYDGIEANLDNVEHLVTALSNPIP